MKVKGRIQRRKIKWKCRKWKGMRGERNTEMKVMMNWNNQTKT